MEEFKDKMNSWRAWGSSDQILVLFCKKESQVKANSKQESLRFIKAKVHTRVGCRLTREKERAQDDWVLNFFCFPWRQSLGKPSAEVASVSPPSRRGAWVPAFLPHVVFPELSWWRQGYDGSCGISNVAEIIMI